MTSNPAHEVSELPAVFEVQQFSQGKMPPPESPLPIHVPELQNIPVLQKQLHPDLDLVSTHVDEPSMLFRATEAVHADLEAPMGVETPNSHGGVKVSEEIRTELESDPDHSAATIRSSDTLKEEAEHHDKQQNYLIPTTQPFVSFENSESLSFPAQSNLASFTPYPSHHQATDTLAQAANDEQHTQDALMNRGLSPFPENVNEEPLGQDKQADADVTDEIVNLQTLPDNLPLHTSNAPTTENIVTVPAAVPPDVSQTSSPSLAQTPIATFPTPAGLPPRPPPQEKPAIHPNYTPDEDIRSYHNPPQHTNTSPSYNTQISSAYRPSQSYALSNGIAPNGMPPPPLATFQQSSLNSNQLHNSAAQTSTDHRGDEDGKSIPAAAQQQVVGQDGHQHGQNPEQLYNDFLREEAVYVSEGTWDRFPRESRLFVGNLYTEKVTKRDLFNVFSKYGRLAQISMKSAYGFVQYVDAGCSYRALQAEEGVEIRGRKIHLEISKPQKNTRNATTTSAGENLRAGHGRRSRSPDYGRGNLMRGGPRSDVDRYDRTSTFQNLDRRGRDDYRPNRSPSPRGYRGRDDYRGRDRSPDRYFSGRQTRSRSPYGRVGRYRSRSPRFRDPDDEESLPIARRMPNAVPDVQLILVDEVDRTFVGYIAQSFRDRGLRCEILQLPRVSLAAVIRRQVLEGVQAVVKIFRTSQVTGKIPLQVFNRSSGAGNVEFEEYENLDANVAAEIAVRAKTTHVAPPAPVPYHNASTYGGSQYGQNSQQISAPAIPAIPAQQSLPGQPPNIANLITSLDGPALQKLLGQMGTNGQSPQTPQNSFPHQTSQQPGSSQDLAALLSSVARQQTSQQQSPQQQTFPFSPQYVQPSAHMPQQPYQQPNNQASPHQYPQEYPHQNGPALNTAYANNPALSQLLAKYRQ